MKFLNNIDQAIPVLNALGSQIRINIVKLLCSNNELSLNDIAQKLNITNGALTPHIKILNEAGLINIRLVTLPRGVSKMVSLAEDKIIIEFFDSSLTIPSYDLELNVGQYSEYKACSPCGLATFENFVGGLDSDIYFTFPDRFKAEIVWLTSGYLVYSFPYLVSSDQNVEEIQITMEISGEAPGTAKHYPSTIDLFINDIHLGKDYLPGERFERRGKLTPSWWKDNYAQYGWLKLYSINNEGTYFNGERVSDVTISDLNLDKDKVINFKISCEDRSINKGGITLFGKRFGDQEQGIKLRISYTPKN